MFEELSQTRLKDDEGGKGIGFIYGLSVPLADKVANGSLRIVDGAACGLCGFVRRVVLASPVVTV